MIKKIKANYLVITLILVVLALLFFSASYAFLTNSNEQHGKLNIKVGDLHYKIESNDLVNQSITVEANTTKELTVELTSLNSIDSKYELYYELDKVNNDIELGYSSSTTDPVLGTIKANEKKNISLVIVNNSNNNSTISINVIGGLVNNTLVLGNGNSLNNLIELANCNYEVGQVWSFDYTGTEEEFVVPCSGIYKLEVYGAQGGSANYVGGGGGYASGDKQLSVNQSLFINVGGAGSSQCVSSSCNGGYNGGGTSYNVYDNNVISGGGGGATHIAKTSGLLSSLSDDKESIYIVAGGGGGSSYYTSTEYGIGGTGGGTSGTSGTMVGQSYLIGSGGTSTIGGSGMKSGDFGQGGSYAAAPGGPGGGGGYYGGGAGFYSSGAGGGSGYIGGVANGSMQNGVRAGNGYAQITLLSKANDFGDIILIENELITEIPTLSIASSACTSSTSSSDSSTTTISCTEADTSGLYKSTDTNSGSSTYYFRGNVINNYVDFAGLTWRIVRINEDGTVRLILDDSINISNKICYTGTYSGVTNMYYSACNSAITDLNNWYSSNLSSYSSKVATGDYFCEAAKVKSSSNYDGHDAAMTLYSSYIPSFTCNEDGNGYGIVNSNIGLISYDEVVYAGGYYGQVNTNYYLYNGTTYWTMSPSGYQSLSGNGWYNGSSLGTDFSGTNYYLRPVINLVSSVKVTGTGTSTDPYVVQ